MPKANMDKLLERRADAVTLPSKTARNLDETELEINESATARITFDVTPELRRAYRMWTVQNSTTVREHLTEYLRQTLEP